jgi:ribosomal protein S27AE
VDNGGGDIVERVKMFCWHCGKGFMAEPKNVYAGAVFCSEKCEIDEKREEIKRRKDETHRKTTGRPMAKGG